MEQEEEPEEEYPIPTDQPRFQILSWKAVAMYWYCGIETCAICREPIADYCIECQINENKQNCVIANGDCHHRFHLHCINRWLRHRDVCPLDNTIWRLNHTFQAPKREIAHFDDDTADKCHYCNEVIHPTWMVMCKHHTGDKMKRKRAESDEYELYWSCCDAPVKQDKPNGCKWGFHVPIPRSDWLPENHRRYPIHFKRIVKAVLSMCLFEGENPRYPQSYWYKLPKEITYYIIQLVARYEPHQHFPISS